jgi:hypothetical protein
MEKKLIVSFFVVLMLSSFFFISTQTVHAEVSVRELTGKLNGASYIIRMPDNYNGDLIVCCRGYSPLLSQLDLNIYANAFNARVQTGCALALSDYGAGGFCIQQGMNTTRQLTQYFIDNFGVTGKIYLVGISMGGIIALELGVKYPKLYAGVIDVSGSKDIVARYNLHSFYAGITDNNSLANAVIANGGTNPPFPLPTIGDFRVWCQTSVNDTINECGGTPDEKPQAYANISPIYNASDLAIPTISIHGTADTLAPYPISVAYMNAVTAAGHANLYRLYKVDGGQHVNAPVLGQMAIAITQMINWVEHGVAPPPSTANPNEYQTPTASAFTSVTIFSGQSWYFIAISAGGMGTHRYQWYEGSTAITGENQMLLKTTRTTPGTYSYYCKATDSIGVPATTNTINLTVLNIAVK